jgi:hypothetical protein
MTGRNNTENRQIRLIQQQMMKQRLCQHKVEQLIRKILLDNDFADSLKKFHQTNEIDAFDDNELVQDLTSALKEFIAERLLFSRLIQDFATEKSQDCSTEDIILLIVESIIEGVQEVREDYDVIGVFLHKLNYMMNKVINEILSKNEAYIQFDKGNDVIIH